MNKSELPVSTVISDKVMERGEMSTSAKLEFLDGFKKAEYARPDEPSRVIYFPGKTCVWKPRHFYQLEASVDKALKLLPVQPVRQSLAVKLWLGMLPHREPKGYKEIATLFNISERQARYQVQQGLSTLRWALEEEGKQSEVLRAP